MKTYNRERESESEVLGCFAKLYKPQPESITVSISPFITSTAYHRSRPWVQTRDRCLVQPLQCRPLNSLPQSIVDVTRDFSPLLQLLLRLPGQNLDSFLTNHDLNSPSPSKQIP